MKQLRLILCILLFPLTVWYAVGVALRNMLYRKGILKSARPSVATISIGNLRMGGTGKTPHTEYLIRLFDNAGIKTALLSRGYGRSTHGYVLADTNSDATTLGDEPYMMSHKFPSLTTAVCEDRLEGLRQLSLLTDKPAMVLLDDAYQHRHLTPALNILLTEYSDLYCDDHILPFGNLREARHDSRRADIIIVTKCPYTISDSKREAIRKCLNPTPLQHLFFSFIEYAEPLPLYGNLSWSPVKEVLLVTGIANPKPLKHHLETRCTVHHISFSDHHGFSDANCRLIINRFNSMSEPSKAIVTTEKDAVRMLTPEVRQKLKNLPLFFIPIKVNFFEDQEFDKTIMDFFTKFAHC